MCLAVPAQLMSRPSADEAVADLHGNQVCVSTVLVPDAIIGDWVLVHAGFAIQKLEPDEVKETWAVLDDLRKAEAAQADQPAARHSDGSLSDQRNLDSRPRLQSPEIPHVAKAPFGMTSSGGSTKEPERFFPCAADAVQASQPAARHSDGSLSDLRNLDSRPRSQSPEIPHVAKAPFGMTSPGGSMKEPERFRCGVAEDQQT